MNKLLACIYGQFCLSTALASSPVYAKNGGLPGTHCLLMHLISPRCGDSGLFLILSCHVMSEFGFDIIDK